MAMAAASAGLLAATGRDRRAAARDRVVRPVEHGKKCMGVAPEF